MLDLIDCLWCKKPMSEKAPSCKHYLYATPDSAHPYCLSILDNQDRDAIEKNIGKKYRRNRKLFKIINRK